MSKAKPLEAIPPNLAPFQVGEKIAFPDVVGSPSAIADAERVGAVEARHPNHRFAGMYGRIEAIGVADGKVAFDVTVIDPATGEPVSENLERATMEEIQ